MCTKLYSTRPAGTSRKQSPFRRVLAKDEGNNLCRPLHRHAYYADIESLAGPVTVVCILCGVGLPSVHLVYGFLRYSL